MNRFYRLLAYGYLPKELPPIFFSGYFAKEVKQSYSDLSTIIKSKWSKPSKYLLQQRARYKRPTSIMHPSAIAKIADSISNNYEEITQTIDQGSISVSKPRFNRKTKFQRAVSSQDIGSTIKEKKLLLRSSFPIILKCDVKNYYKSIYTHSIPWAIHGKEYSKINHKSPIAGNQIDSAIRQGQDGQTIGIPVGPDTSFIIGEIILASVDKELGFDHEKAIRFYDDYEFGCNSELEAESIIEHLENILAQFELELNHDKTIIIKGPNPIENSWRQVLNSHIVRKDIIKSEDYIDLFNITSDLAKANKSDFVFKYFIRSMRRTIITERNWPIWQNILFAIAFADFGNLRVIYEQLDLYERIGYKINKKALQNLLETKAHQEFKTGITSELSWVLFGLYKFKIKPARELIDKVLKSGDDVSRILAIKIAKDKRIGIKKNIESFKDYLGDNSARGDHWFLLWEIYINGWLKDRDLKNELLSENIFEFLNTHKVTFLRDTDVDLFEIPKLFRNEIAKNKGQDALEKLLAEIRERFPDTKESDLDSGDTEQETKTDSDDEDSDFFY